MPFKRPSTKKPSESSRMSDYVGRVLKKRYKLGQILGSGSYGTVFQAVDLKAPPEDNERAIKIIMKTAREAPSHVAFRREITLHKRASKHPNVVTLQDAYEDRKHFVFVMDHCRGGDLGHYLEHSGPYIDGNKLRAAFLQLVNAVHALHAQGIYHRDLKPHNILVSEDGSELFIADFGLSSTRNEYTYYCGTAAYMPPECIADEPSVHRRGEYSDIWALGLILINMLTGCQPWLRATHASDIYTAFVDDPRFLLNCFPLSPGANRIIRRMLRANPLIRARLPDVRQWVVELDSFYQYSGRDRLDVAGMWKDLEKMRSTLRSEMVLDWAQLDTSSVQLDDGYAAVTSDVSSARSSWVVVTPKKSDMDASTPEKKAIGERVRILVSWFANRKLSGQPL